MTDENRNMELTREENGEALLKQLLHLKRYETPEVGRMTRNRQNIMRQVREASQSKRKSLSDLIEGSFPWLFAEPKYGVALLFVAFMGLQYLGANARHAAQSDIGIYSSSPTATAQVAAYGQPQAAVATNNLIYPQVPENFQMFPFPARSGSGEVKWVENLKR